MRMNLKTEAENQEEKFDCYDQWYTVIPICDLHKRRPHEKRDGNDNDWKVFDDNCLHRLSQGRIDQWGRLPCVYHSWCFGASASSSLKHTGMAFHCYVGMAI
ncbi:Protochlorophyllide-dependent translocon component 52 [Forsythia ovata]|uniref:Protochlorophyllide-dependent translocon component 52 n=1 Tax=Forsythia ovata TaxID=205694 RepID=A0ABD1WRJ3_9LAMI